MIQPGFADRMEFTPEPTANDIHRDATVGELIHGGELLRSHGWVPGTGQDGDDELQSFGRSQERMAKEHRLMLKFSAVAGGKADLAQRIVEPVVFRGLGELPIIVDVPASALFDIADNQTTADIRNPIGKADWFATRVTD